MRYCTDVLGVSAIAVAALVASAAVASAQGENARRYVSAKNARNPHMLYAYTPGTISQTILSNSTRRAPARWRRC